MGALRPLLFARLFHDMNIAGKFNNPQVTGSKSAVWQFTKRFTGCCYIFLNLLFPRTSHHDPDPDVDCLMYVPPNRSSAQQLCTKCRKLSVERKFLAG